MTCINVKRGESKQIYIFWKAIIEIMHQGDEAIVSFLWWS